MRGTARLLPSNSFLRGPGLKCTSYPLNSPASTSQSTFEFYDNGVWILHMRAESCDRERVVPYRFSGERV